MCDGFTGNLILKLGESVATHLQSFLFNAVKGAKLDEGERMKFGKVKTALAPFNYENVGGIPFLGVDGVSLVGHGSSSPEAIKNMIMGALRVVEREVNSKIVSALKG